MSELPVKAQTRIKPQPAAQKEATRRPVLAQYNAAQAAPAWRGQASVPINIDKDSSQPGTPDNEYIYRSN